MCTTLLRLSPRTPALSTPPIPQAMSYGRGHPTPNGARGKTGKRRNPEAWSILYFLHSGIFPPIPGWFKLTNWSFWLLSFLTSNGLFSNVCLTPAVDRIMLPTNVIKPLQGLGLGEEIVRKTGELERSVQLLREKPVSEREQMVPRKGVNVFSMPHGTVLRGITFGGWGWG